MRAIVTVMPKQSVLDPQGVAVRDAMHHLGLENTGLVRVGKIMEIDLGASGPEIEGKLHEACRDLLSNPVIEDYRLELEP